MVVNLLVCACAQGVNRQMSGRGVSMWVHTNVGARRGGEKWGVCTSVCICVQGGHVCNGNGVHECECEGVC